MTVASYKKRYRRKPRYCQRCRVSGNKIPADLTIHVKSSAGKRQTQYRCVDCARDICVVGELDLKQLGLL